MKEIFDVMMTVRSQEIVGEVDETVIYQDTFATEKLAQKPISVLKKDPNVPEEVEFAVQKRNVITRLKDITADTINSNSVIV